MAYLFAGTIASSILFGFKRFESVKCLQFYCNELPFVFAFDMYKWKFLTCVSSVHNDLSFFHNIDCTFLTALTVTTVGATKSHEQMKSIV